MKIGLATSVLEAEKLARENARPIFLFTHDGKMNVGRCRGGAFARRPPVNRSQTCTLPANHPI